MAICEKSTNSYLRKLARYNIIKIKDKFFHLKYDGVYTYKDKLEVIIFIFRGVEFDLLWKAYIMDCHKALIIRSDNTFTEYRAFQVSHNYEIRLSTEEEIKQLLQIF